MAGVTYSLSSLISFLVILLIMSRVTRYETKNDSVKLFIVYLASVALYSLVDAVLGYCLYGGNKYPGMVILTLYYALLCIGILVALLWYEYSIFHLYVVSKKKDRKLYLADAIPGLIGLQIIFINPTTHTFFYLNDEGGLTGTPFIHIIIFFMLSYHITVAVRYFLHMKAEETSYEKMRSLVEIIATILFMLGTILQFLMPVLPFLSMAYMLGTLAILIYNISIESEEALNDAHNKENIARTMMISALSDEYDIIFWVNLDDNSYKSFATTEFHRKMHMKTEGEDFFADAVDQISKAVSKEDAAYVLENLSRDYVIDSISKENSYSFIYRVVIGGALMYYETKVVRSADANDNSVIMVGIKNVDSRERRELRRKRDLRNLERKELESRKALQQALENQNEIYAEMLHMQSGGVIVTDKDNRIIICNEAASDLFDMPLNVMMDDFFPDVVEDCLKESVGRIKTGIEKLREKGDEISLEYPVYHLDNRTTFIKADSKVATLSNQTSVVITSLTDITTNKEMEHKLVLLSETDNLTGLRNRKSGFARAEQLIKKNADGMLCIIDINKFKHINDSYGHPAGDKVLKAIAGCMKRAFRRKDILMRIGGDEFAVFAVDVTDETVGAKCLNRFFEDINVITIPEMDEDERVSVSVGAILCPAGKTGNFTDMYKKADEAMYTCKGHNECRFAFYHQNFEGSDSHE